jgi:hypothetical protein
MLYGDHRYQLDALELQLSGRESGLEVAYEYAEGIFVGVVVDTGDQYVRISQDILQDWRTDFSSVFKAALDSTTGREIPIGQIGEGVFLIQGDISFTAAIWAMKQLGASLPINGTLLVMAPTRDTCVVAGDQTPGVFSILAEILRQLAANTDLETAAVYRSVGEKHWDRVDWATTDADPEVIHRIQLDHLNNGYTRQQPMLQQVMASQGLGGVTIADFQIVQKPDGQVISLTTLVQDSPTMLPQADEVVCVTNTGKPFGLTWQQLTTALGDKLVIGDQYTPIRYMTDQFPRHP